MVALTRLDSKVLLRRNKVAVAKQFLFSRRFSFRINAGMQHDILAYTISLKTSLNKIMIDIGSKNAHTFRSRDILEE